MAQAQMIYTTKDGKRYSDKAMAERHERLTEAREKYESAQRAYTQALLETQVTADGKPFEFGALEQYYYVHPNYGGGMPFLKTVYFSRWDTRLDESDELNVLVKGDDGRDIAYRISNLYANRRKAEIALLHQQMERVSDLSADIVALRQRLGLMDVDIAVGAAALQGKEHE